MVIRWNTIFFSLALVTISLIYNVEIAGAPPAGHPVTVFHVVSANDFTNGIERNLLNGPATLKDSKTYSPDIYEGKAVDSPKATWTFADSATIKAGKVIFFGNYEWFCTGRANYVFDNIAHKRVYSNMPDGILQISESYSFPSEIQYGDPSNVITISGAVDGKMRGHWSTRYPSDLFEVTIRFPGLNNDLHIKILPDSTNAQATFSVMLTPYVRIDKNNDVFWGFKPSLKMDKASFAFIQKWNHDAIQANRDGIAILSSGGPIIPPSCRAEVTGLWFAPDFAVHDDYLFPPGRFSIQWKH